MAERQDLNLKHGAAGERGQEEPENAEKYDGGRESTEEVQYVN
jgi:hypothetical protein